MKITVSTTYDVIWQLKDHTHYKFTKDGICINSKRNKQAKTMIAFLIITGYLIGLIGFYRFHKWFSIKVEDEEWGWFTVIRGFILSLIWPLGYIVVFIADWINIIDYIENNFPKPPKWL